MAETTIMLYLKVLMASQLSRREFLKLSLLATGAAGSTAFRDYLPPDEAPPIHGFGRIAWDWLPVRAAPGFSGEPVGRRDRDQVIPLLEEVISPEGPSYNPLWYRIVGGYIFSGYIQPVRKDFQSGMFTLPDGGALTEVTIPWVDSLRYQRETGWRPLYRLYYHSTHWVTSIDPGPDGEPWYGITDDLNRQKYHVPAYALRRIEPEEIAPISPEVPLQDKRIEVSISEQTLRAFERDMLVLEARVSTGVETVGKPSNGIPTDTPYGAFRVNRKMPVRHMGNGDLVSNLTNYELPGVPWVCFFVSTGVALHGAYWHANFGRRMSHGCVNMRPEDAKWIYRWTLPAGGVTDWYVESPGTKITVV